MYCDCSWYTDTTVSEETCSVTVSVSQPVQGMYCDCSWYTVTTVGEEACTVTVSVSQPV